MYALLDQREPIVASDAEAVIAKAAAERLRPIADAGQDVRIFVQDDVKVSVPLPARMVALMVAVLESMAERIPISLVPHDAELTTQQAADFLNVSRPFLVGLLDQGLIDHRKVGSHRRVRYGDLLAYETKSKKDRRAAIEAMIEEARRLGLE